MDAVGGGRRQRLALGSAATDAAALGVYLASAALFLVEVIGLGPTLVGVILGLGGAASMVGAVPIARLTERVDAGRVLGVLFIARGCAFACFALARDPVTATVVITAAGFLNRGIGPIIQAVALEDADEGEQVKILARIRALRNAGIGLGGVPIGFVVASGSPLGFRLMIAAAGVVAGSAAVLAFLLPSSTAQSQARGLRKIPMDRGFVLLTSTYGLMTLSGIVMGLGLPLLIVQSTGIPRWTVGGIQVGNTVMVVALQVTFSRGSERLGRARAMLVAAGACTALGCLLMLQLHYSAGTTAVALVAATVIVFTVAELLASSGGMGMMLSFIPPGQRTRYLAVFNLGFAGATIIGPPLVGLALAYQPWSWAVLAVTFLAAAAMARVLPSGTQARSQGKATGTAAGS